MKYKNLTSRFVSVLMAVVMVVSMLPVSAVAVEETAGESAEVTIPLGDFAAAGVGKGALTASTVQLSQKSLIAVPYPGAELTLAVNDGYQACVYSGNNSNRIDQNSGWIGTDGDGETMHTYTLPESSIYMRVSIRRTDGGAVTPEDLVHSGLAVTYESASDIVRDNSEVADVLENTELPVLIHISDIHGDVIRAGRAAQFADAVSAAALLASGDLTAYEPDDWGNALFDAVGNYPDVNFLYGVGNHDTKNISASAYQETIYNAYFKENPSTPNGETYYYRDLAGQKLRIISVNQQEGASTTTSGGTCYSQAQVDWLVETMKSTPAGYGVMLMYHSPETTIAAAGDPNYSEFFQIGNRYDNPTNSYSGYSGTFLMDLVDAFMLRESFTWSYSEKNGASPVTLNADFTQVAEGVEFIAHVTGHVHADSITYLPGSLCKQLLLGVTCTTSMYGADGGYYGLADYSDLNREADNANQDAFNAYVIDRENKTVRVLRVGARQTISGETREDMTIPYSIPFEEGDYPFDTEGLVKLDLSNVEWVNYGIQAYGVEPTYKPGVRYSTNAIFDVPYEGVTFYIKINAPYELGIRSGATDTTMTTNYYWLNNKSLTSGDQNRGYVYTIPSGHEKFILSIANVTRDNSNNVTTTNNPINALELQAADVEIWYSPASTGESQYLFETENKVKLDLEDVVWVNYGYQPYGPEPTYLPGVRLTSDMIFDTPYEGVTFYIKINAPYELGIRSGETETSMNTNRGWLNNKCLPSGNSNYGFVYTIPAGHHKFILTIGNVTRNSSNNISNDKNPITLEELEAAGLEIWYEPKEPSFSGKTISILGDSISTFGGVSNNANSNSTIGGNATYYSGQGGITRADTWWQQVVDVLDMELLVNNSWSGSCVFQPRKGEASVGYTDRCVNLHNDHTGEEPDLILVFLGTNDFKNYPDTLGVEADIDYDAIIADNGDGTYTYATATTTCEAYAIMLHKMSVRYPNADIYCMSLLPRKTGPASLTKFNQDIAVMAERFGCSFVDLEHCGITPDAESMEKYMYDGSVHPNAEGMDLMSQAVVSALTGKNTIIRDIEMVLTNVAADNNEHACIDGESFTTKLTSINPKEKISVTITMSGEDITASAYDNGNILIENVTGDVKVVASAERGDITFRWEYSNGELVNTVNGEYAANALAKQRGSANDGVFEDTYYRTQHMVKLLHDKPWTLEWRGSGSGGFMLSDATSAASSTVYFRRHTIGYLYVFGMYDGSQYNHYGVKPGDYGIDDKVVHTYRMENRIDADGNNMVYFFVDGVEIGAMNNYYVGYVSQGTTDNWISGKDFCINYIGTSTHPLDAYSMEYLQIWENGHTHTYTPAITAPTCTEQGYTTYTCTTCGDSYVADYVEAEGHSFSEWYTTKEAAYPEQGEECRDCVKCSHVEFREVPLTVITSGNFGKGSTPTDKVKYTLYSDGTMVIEGTGETFYCDWNASKQPFIEYRSEVKHLIITEGITVVNRGCFAYLTNLETVSFPSTLISLQGNCFMGSFVKKVSSMTIPRSVCEIGVAAFGSSSGETFFTDIVIENPNIKFPPESNPYYYSVFNYGRKPETVTLYSYGADNEVSEYAKAIGYRYVDLENYSHGKVSGISYSYYAGELVLEALEADAVIPTNDQPWAEYRNSIERILIKTGIEDIPDGAFRDYTALTTIELPADLKRIGDGAFATTEQTDTTIEITLPRRLEYLGSDVFKGRFQVNVTAYYGSIAENIQEKNVNLILKRQFKMLMIGNSFTNDAANCAQGMKESQLFNILHAMLGEDAEITLGVIMSGGKTMAWHATQAEQDNRKYSFNVVASGNGKWVSMGSASSKEALSWGDWDAVILQPYQVDTGTGKEIVPYPEETDEKFYRLEDASAYMLDHMAAYAPYAEAYCYMHWATGSTIALNAGLGSYNRYAEFYPTVLNYAGTETGKQFTDIVPIGLSVQNARTTYFALLEYNTAADELNLNTDTQKGLLRDSVHVSFNIGRYIAGLTVAETVISEDMRAEGYILPDIRITESVGRLPKEYTEIAQKAVFAAVESWKNGSLAVTNIEGYTEDPTVTARETVENLTLSLHCDADELAGKIAEQVLAALPADFAVDKVELPTDLTAGNLTCDVTIRFGYTSLTVPVEFNFAPHDYAVGICTFCGHDCVEVNVDNSTLTVTCDELELDTLIWLVSYDGNGKFVAMKRVTLGEALTLPAGERYVLLFVDENWTPLRKQLDI